MQAVAAVAPLDCLAHLPGPPLKANRAAASLYAGQLLAYAASSAVVVVDVQRMAVATTLAGAHRQAAVTTLAWHPGGGAREPKAAAQLRLASGDEEGRVMVWNVNTGAVIAALEDPWASAFGTGGSSGAGSGRRPEGGRPPVVGVAWVTASPSVLAILLAPCILLLWDYRTGSVVWRKDLGQGVGGGESFTSLAVDPLDRRRLVLCGSKGAFVVLSLTNPGADRVRQQQYQVDLGSTGSLRCAFSATQDLLFLLLQRELIVFDLEYGQPAASTPLPSSKAPLEDLLACYGHAAAGKTLQDGGIDVLYCSHRDGSVSTWQRHARLLTYSCLGASKLMPPPLKIGTAPTVVSLAAGLWRGLEAGPAAAASISPLYQIGGKRHPGTARRVSSSSEMQLGGGGGGGGSSGSINAGAEADADAAAAGGRGASSKGEAGGGSPRSVLVMGVSSDGRVWQWQMPLLSGTLADPKAAAAALPPPKPELLGLLHTLPQRVTSFTACPTPVPLPGVSGAITTIAAATAAGTIEVAAVQQGPLLPLHISISTCLAAHTAPVQGLRWLGTTPRLVSYSSEKVAGGYKNTLLVTDVRNRVSLPFRQQEADLAPLAGVRASPSGRYLLVLFRGGPSEIWSVGGGSQPSRLRQIDLQFTAVEWLSAEGQPAAVLGAVFGSSGSVGGTSSNPWSASPRAAERAAAGYAFDPEAEPPEDPQEERLAFSLLDGRTGVLAIRGRRISDTRPRRPAWPPLAVGDYRAVAIGSWAQGVLLGDAKGTLVHWDTVNGRCNVLETGFGKVAKIYSSPPPKQSLYPAAASVVARVAVLFSAGVFAVYDLEQGGELRGTHVTATAAAARIGRVTDVEWLPLPQPIGGGTVLAASLEDGSLALFDTVHNIDVRPRRARMLRYRAALHTAPPPGARRRRGEPWGLLASPPSVAAALLPHAWARLLRLLLQRGLPEGCFRELAALAAYISGSSNGGSGSSSSSGGGSSGRAAEAERALERLEEEIWSRLPRGCQAVWDSLLVQRGEEGGGVESPRSMRQILDTFADDSEEGGNGSGISGGLGGLGGGGSSSSGLDVAAVAALRPSVSPRWTGSTDRDEAAAAALGLTSPPGGMMTSSGSSGKLRGEVAQTFKSLGGAFKGIAKDVASASKSQLKSLAGGGSSSGGGGGSGGGGSGGGGGGASLVTAVAGISDGYEFSQPKAAFHSLVAVLHAVAIARGQPAVLTPAELAAYSSALGSHRVADRMALAAELTGEESEALFWRRLPATLAWLAAALQGQQAAQRRVSVGGAERSSGGGGGGGGGGGSVHTSPTRRTSVDAAGPAGPAAAAGSGTPSGSSIGSGGLPPLGAASMLPGGRRLWEEGAELAAATERSGWHEQMSRRVFEDSQELQEKRVLEYASLGDFQTAVGFLLASPPDRSTRYYRDALCTLGMAFACGLQHQQAALVGGAGAGAGAGSQGPSLNGGSGSGSGNSGSSTAAAAAAASVMEDNAARTLFVQAAKVITANAASVGDTLLGVPLLCSTGQHADAASLLQDSGLWRYAAALCAHSLRGAERAAAMERWAGHVAAAEGRPWTAAGLLVAAGCLKSALQLLRQHGLPDAAQALVGACRDAGLPLQPAGALEGSSELANLWVGGQQAIQRFNSVGERVPEMRLGSSSGNQQPPSSQHQQGAGAGAAAGAGGLQRADTLGEVEQSETAREFVQYVVEVLQQL